MNFIRSIRMLCAVMAMVFAFAGAVNAESSPEATMNIVNNTHATLVVKVERLRGNFSDNVEITIPPLTERRAIVPAGYVKLTAIASKSSPVKEFTEGFAISNGSFFEYNIFAGNFGMHMLADKPVKGEATGVTVNISRVIMNGSAECSQADLKSGFHWNITNPNNALSSSDYYEHGGYLCGDEKTGFYMLGEPMLYFACSANFTNCQRDKKNDGFERPPFKDISWGGKPYVQGKVEWVYGNYGDWTLTKEQ